ncbi:hypothetical protein LIER_27477 [Lithospermum erythrorhizon]|uniref:Uncharacterized protein n=1 Tax=Lithospermum erythrorhizon TaxID=34254 RepID=A0AAV3RFT5_LITER
MYRRGFTQLLKEVLVMFHLLRLLMLQVERLLGENPRGGDIVMPSVVDIRADIVDMPNFENLSDDVVPIVEDTSKDLTEEVPRVGENVFPLVTDIMPINDPIVKNVKTNVNETMPSTDNTCDEAVGCLIQGQNYVLVKVLMIPWMLLRLK